MEQSSVVITKLIEIDKLLSQMHTHAMREKGRNVEFLKQLQTQISHLKQMLSLNQLPNHDFLSRWKLSIGYSSRYFEGHPILEMLRSVDKVINSNL